MKNKFDKIISVLLILTFLMSCFTVFSFAEDEGGAEENQPTTSDLHVIMNRDFDDGWEINNGFGIVNEHEAIFSITKEELADYSYNYFAQVEATLDGSSYFQLSYDNQPTAGGSILEFDVKIDDYNNMGNILYVRTPGGAAKGTVGGLLSIIDNKLVLMGGYDIGLMDQGWIHLGYNMNFDQTELICPSCNQFSTWDEEWTLSEDDGVDCPHCSSSVLLHRVKFRIFFSLKDHFDPEHAIDGTGLSGALNSSNLVNTYYYDYTMIVGSSTDMAKWTNASMDFFRFGVGVGAYPNIWGQKVQFDNIKLYSKADQAVGTFMDFRDITEEGYGYGSKVDETKAKTIAIDGGSSLGDIVKEGIIMKTNSKYLLHQDAKANIYTDEQTGEAYGAPRKIDGQVYVPLEPILEMTGYPYLWHSDNISCDISTEAGSSILTIGRDVAIVNGSRVMLTAAPQYVEDDKTDNVYPVIALEDVETLFQGWYVTYDTMGLICVCKEDDVFDRKSGLSIMLDYMKKFVFDFYSGEELYDLVKEYTNDFDHPYLMADQERFDYIYDVWTGKIDEPVLKGWLETYVNKGKDQFKIFTSKPVGEHVAKLKYADGTIYDFSQSLNSIDGTGKYKWLRFELTNPLECGIKNGLWIDEKYDYGQYPHFGKVDGYIDPETGARDAGYVGMHYNDGSEIETGRVVHMQTIAGEIWSVAFAYVITRDVKYAELTWDLINSVMEFRHWGQHQFLAVAEVAHKFGQIFDWLYDVWTEELNYDTNRLAQALYEKCVWFGYVVTIGELNSDWYEDYSIQPGTTAYNLMAINWNAVCTTGLTMAELAIFGEQDKNGVDRRQGTDCNGDPYTEIDFTTTRGHWDNPQELNILYYTMSSNIQTLMTIGLDQYPPDGSFIESPAYWAYATNTLAEMIWALNTSLGDDLGITDFGGMDTTWYFPYYAEYNSDEMRKDGYIFWNYHDSGIGETAATVSFAIGEILEDSGLIALRLKQIMAGSKDVSYNDILGYKSEYIDLMNSSVELEKDYICENLDGIFARSSWERGCVFTGLMGDANNCTAHGQIDSANFIYANLNYTWICDIGSDEYDLYQYFEAPTRYLYFRNSGEGANHLIVTNQPETLPNGQLYTGAAPLQNDEYISNEYGVKAIVDGNTLFSPYTNEYKRGLLFTNSRSTVVIQDKWASKTALDVAWIAYTKVKSGNVTISDDGKTLYLRQKLAYDGEAHTVRLTIVEPVKTELKFEFIDPGITTFLLETTHRWGYSESMGKAPQYNRYEYNRIVIRDDKAMNFNVAVVIELLDDELGYDMPVEYDWQDMRDWVPEKEYTGKNLGSSAGNGEGGIDETIETLKPKDIIENATNCKRFIDSGFAFSTRTTDFFKCLARVNNGFNSLNIDRYQGVTAMEEAYANYQEYMKQYNAFKDDINAKLYMDITLTKSFTGL